MSEEAAKLEQDNRLAIATLREKLDHFNESLKSVSDVSAEMRDEAKEIASGLTKITERLSQYNTTQKVDKNDILREITDIRGKVDEFAKNNATVSQFHRDFVELRRVIDGIKSALDVVTTKFDIHEKTGQELLIRMTDEKREGCSVCMKVINTKFSAMDDKVDAMKVEISTLTDDNDNDKKLRYGIKGFWIALGVIGTILGIVLTLVKLYRMFNPLVPEG